MKSVFSRLLVVSVCFFILTSPVTTDAYTQATHSELQAVYNDGTSAWNNSGSITSISLIGVVVNNPEDMSDYTSYSPYVWWQTYIQALPAGEYGGNTVAEGDYGGTALYMRAALPWLTPPVTLYDAEQWDAELNRITDGYTLQYGDIVKVEALAPGMFFRGKYNVNEQHDNDPTKDFTVTVIGQTTPEFTSITLANLKNTNNDFIFREDRQTGCEHYQASLVHLDNLLLVDADDWALDGTVEVKQGTLTFDMKLGLDNDLLSIDADLLETTPFSVTAILDQEDGSLPYTGGYRLWLTNASNLTVVPEPGSLALLVAGGLAALLLWRRLYGRTTA